jgi:membrane protein YqaA with SNARE-associated domain
MLSVKVGHSRSFDDLMVMILYITLTSMSTSTVEWLLNATIKEFKTKIVIVNSYQHLLSVSREVQKRA